MGGVSPLKFRESGTAGDGEQLVVIGHPSGLPTKIAGGAKIRSGEAAYFTANLDTFGGNSGSAVFNATTGIVEGILVRGELDYVSDIVDGKVCKRANKCSDDGCDGEDVTRITSVEGIPVSKVPTLADVKDNIFKGKYVLSSMGGVIPFYSLSIDDNVIGGRKFLDICGIQAARFESPSTWYSNTLGKCSEIQDEIEMVYQDFTDSL